MATTDPYYTIRDYQQWQSQQQALGQSRGTTPDMLSRAITANFQNQQDQQRTDRSYQLEERKLSDAERQQKLANTTQMYQGAASLAINAPAIYKGYRDVFGGGGGQQTAIMGVKTAPTDLSTSMGGAPSNALATSGATTATGASAVGSSTVPGVEALGTTGSLTTATETGTAITSSTGLSTEVAAGSLPQVAATTGTVEGASTLSASMSSTGAGAIGFGIGYGATKALGGNETSAEVVGVIGAIIGYVAFL